MDAELLWQIGILGATALVGSYLGSKVSIAKLETRVEHHHEEIKSLRGQMNEHEGTLTSHSIQLAVLDTSNHRRAAQP